MINWLSEFMAAWGPWIVLSLIPTIITGLSLSPATLPAATVLQKVLVVLKQVLDFLSVAKFKDRPGTFQLPLKLSALKKEEKPEPPASSGCAALVLLLAVSMTMPGCAWFKSTGKDVIKDAIDCATEAAKDSSREIFSVVLAILSDDSGKWPDMLGAFVAEFGKDAVACALQAAAIDIQLSQPQAGTATGDAQLAGLTRARTFIDQNGWTFKEAQ